MSSYPPYSLMGRMNFIEGKYEKIFLLEDENNFDKLKFNDIPSSINDMFSCLKYIYVKYGKNEKKCLINNLKNYFDFIKVVNPKEIDNNESNNNIIVYNEINFLILKNQNYSDDQVLQKINEKKVFENEIKSFLNINEFPLNNYYLKENNNLIKENGCYYNKVYIIKNNEKKSLNYFNKNKSINIEIDNIYIGFESEIDYNGRGKDENSNLFNNKNKNSGINNVIINNNIDDNKDQSNINKALEKFNNFEMILKQMEQDFKKCTDIKFLEFKNYSKSILKDLKDN